MRKTLVVAFAAGLTALAFTKPGLSMPATPTFEHGQISATVLDVGYRDRYWRNRPYYRGYAYGYRPYYPPYYAYRPYAYYGGYPYGGYPYYRRPGISFGFAF